MLACKYLSLGFWGYLHTNHIGTAAQLPGLLVGQELLVPTIGCETNSHLWDDTAENGSKTLVQTESSFSLHDLNASSEETTRFHLPRGQLSRAF